MTEHKPHIKNEWLYGIGAVVVLFLLVASAKGKSSGVSGGGFNAAQASYNTQIYSLAANHDIQVRQTQASVDKEVVKAGVDIVSINSAATNKAAEIQSSRDIGLRQLDVMDADNQRQDQTRRYVADRQSAVSMAQIGAQREIGLSQIDAAKSVGMAQVDVAKSVGMAQVGVQQYNAETQRAQSNYAYDLGKTQLANNYSLGTQKNNYDYQLGQQKNSNDAQKNANEYQLGKQKNQNESDNNVFGFIGGLVGGVLGLFGL